MWSTLLIPSMNGHKYFLTIVDDKSKFTWIFLMRCVLDWSKGPIDQGSNHLKPTTLSLGDKTVHILRAKYTIFDLQFQYTHLKSLTDLDVGGLTMQAPPCVTV